MKSKFLSVGMRDLLRGFVVAVIATILTSILTILQSGLLPDLSQLRIIGITGIAAGVSYLIKNIFTNSSGKLFKGEESKEN